MDYFILPFTHGKTAMTIVDGAHLLAKEMIEEI